jgi:hypothetical protein
MNPEIWGPNAWYVLHYLGHVNDRDGHSPAIEVFFMLFTKLLLCKSCRIHGSRFQAFMKEMGTTVEESARDEKLFEYSWHLHNLVNARLHKPIVGLDEMREAWVARTIDAREDEDEEDAVSRRVLQLWEYVTRVFIHYDQNQETDRQRYYRKFLWILPNLIEAFSESLVNVDELRSMAAKVTPFSLSLVTFLHTLMETLERDTDIATVHVTSGVQRCVDEYARSKNETASHWCKMFLER